MNIKDIAKLADVSTATVSRVINEKPGVKEKVRKKVKKIIKENDYVPNLIARGLVKNKSKTIGLLVPKFVGYYSDRIEAILKTSNENGYDVIIASAMGKFKGELKNLKTLVEKQVEGIIFFAGKLTDEKIDAIEKINMKIPVLLVDQYINESKITSVITDNYKGTIEAMDFLIGYGHKKIAFIDGPYYDILGKDKLKAYKYKMKENKFKIDKGYIQGGDYSIESGYKAIDKLISESNKLPTAILASNDNMAIGTIKRLKQRGYNVPKDISVMGIDDIEISKHYSPAITTMKQNQYEMGKVIADLILDMINKENQMDKKVIFQELMIRDSVKNIK
ncbi:MAG: LacI family DNA-binding transcriptional regulator [Fusobacteriota bacterium]